MVCELLTIQSMFSIVRFPCNYIIYILNIIHEIQSIVCIMWCKIICYRTASTSYIQNIEEDGWVGQAVHVRSLPNLHSIGPFGPLALQARKPSVLKIYSLLSDRNNSRILDWRMFFVPLPQVLNDCRTVTEQPMCDYIENALMWCKVGERPQVLSTRSGKLFVQCLFWYVIAALLECASLMLSAKYVELGP